MMVAIASAHRQAAFAAAEFLMDYLKSRAPFWKKETTAAGDRLGRRARVRRGRALALGDARSLTPRSCPTPYVPRSCIASR